MPTPKRKITVLLLLLLVAFPVNAKTILVLGDSISAAFGIDPKEGWVSLLEKRLREQGYADYRPVNASVSGNTTGDGLGRLPALLQQYWPDIVILELGGNDGLRGYPVTIMKNNLQKMIDLSRSSGARVLLAGIEIPPNYGQRYTDAFRRTFDVVAREEEVLFLPFILEGIATNKDLMQKDLIHPTAEAQPTLLENIWPYLERLLQKIEP